MRRITHGVKSTLADAREAMQKRAAARRPPSVSLESVRRRLELLLAGLYGRQIGIDVKLAPRRKSWSDALRNPLPKHMRGASPSATTDGSKVLLPRTIADPLGEESARQRYRILAVEQAERVVRGTPLVASGIDAPLVRDLFLLAEASAIDASITRAMRGSATLLRGERKRMLAARTTLRGLTAVEMEVESHVRAMLASSPEVSVAGLPDDATTNDSVAWAVARAKEIGERYDATRYRGMAAVSYWGSMTYVEGAPRVVTDTNPMGVESQGTLTLPTGGARVASEEEDADARGLSANESNEKGVEAQDEARTDGSGAEESVSSAAQGVGAPLLEENGPKAATVVDYSVGVLYDEWDTDHSEYRTKAVRVRPMDATIDENGWADAALDQHAPIVRSIRRRFERLRAQRARLHSQRQGDELDLTACVDALVDRATGHSATDRVYLDVRPARRGMAITVLADVSGSTNSPVTTVDRIIDFEKLAMLLAGEAFDALGDPYSLLTFSSHGAADVQLRTLKAFGDRNGRVVQERIGAVAATGNTRLGAAIRHATVQLTRQPAGHRLLIVLSDGKPSDQDRYMGSYAIEDSRQAIAEARAAGVFPFCLTVDREEPEYMAHMFGRAGYVMLMQPDQLPSALLKAVRHLIGAS
jgi:nitric oxide reductase NorD protein